MNNSIIQIRIAPGTLSSTEAPGSHKGGFRHGRNPLSKVRAGARKQREWRREPVPDTTPDMAAIRGKIAHRTQRSNVEHVRSSRQNFR